VEDWLRNTIIVLFVITMWTGVIYYYAIKTTL